MARPGICRCPCCPPVSPDTPPLSGWLYCTYMWLGQVAVDVLVALLPLQILLLYQDVNALLDHVHLRLEPGEKEKINQR